MLHSIAVPSPYTRTYSYQTPATGFSIEIPNYTQFLILNPAAGLATGTIVMPANPLDGQICGFSTSQAIITLTVNANTGHSILNAPITLGAGGASQFIYIASITTWLRAH